jgi:Cof subfamily protein (haloacid dehalogenase superfamily)
MYKLIAIDLDGTLLNSNGVVSAENKKTLQNLINKNIEIVLASGRMIDSTKTIAKEIGCKKYFIAGNGAIVYDIEKDEIIYENFLKKEKVLDVIKICEENSIYYNIYTDKQILATSLKYNVLYYNKENANRDEKDRSKINIVSNMYEYVQNLEDEKFLKITICDENKMIFNSIIRRIKQIKEIDVLDVEHMSRKIITQGTEQVEVSYSYTEVSAQNVDKWEAIKYILNQEQLTSENVIAIGDNINDKEMIKNAGLGIAMKDSTPVVREIADITTEQSNNSNGVAEALDKILQ